ncbi:Pathogenesis-related transcriptional factor and ERF protein [Sphingobacteriales bacterium UPWRP_1]|nr:Pathogenesis-related transcriptional factor and ERF protein [Sphingobacteriales bacterium TSM_CSM]PSJ74575.1 Pathogenesis-related transcriptional factor and ERF protein [Sphingobacteriales bacterium UPWRP_1]
MIFKVKLKNADKFALLSADVHEFIMNNTYLNAIGFLDNLRLHSNGYVFFQKNHPLNNGGYKNETIYLHKYIAERFVSRPESEQKLYVSIVNGNKLDCRTDNLRWVPRSIAVRNTKKTINKTGYRGVSPERDKYRAVLYKGRVKYDLGFFETAEEAAEAYNKKSEELFGKTRNLNIIGKPRNPKTG